MKVIPFLLHITVRIVTIYEVIVNQTEGIDMSKLKQLLKQVTESNGNEIEISDDVKNDLERKIGPLLGSNDIELVRVLANGIIHLKIGGSALSILNKDAMSASQEYEFTYSPRLLQRYAFSHDSFQKVSKIVNQII